MSTLQVDGTVKRICREPRIGDVLADMQGMTLTVYNHLTLKLVLLAIEDGEVFVYAEDVK
jgi:histone H3/H4